MNCDPLELPRLRSIPVTPISQSLRYPCRHVPSRKAVTHSLGRVAVAGREIYRQFNWTACPAVSTDRWTPPELSVRNLDQRPSSETLIGQRLDVIAIKYIFDN